MIYVRIYTNYLADIGLCIYCAIKWRTGSLYRNSSVWQDTQDTSIWDQNSRNFTLDMVSNRSDI